MCRRCSITLDANNCYPRKSGPTCFCRECEGKEIELRASTNFRAELASVALSYAERGWWLLPLETPTLAVSASGQRVPACSCGCLGPRAGKHPRIQKDNDPLAFASNRKEDIQKWFDWWPSLNIGVVCSPESGVFGIDVDYSNDGHESMPLLEKLIGDLSQASVVQTGDGYHLYFKHPGLKIPDFHNVLPGIDIRSEKAYLVAPPSLHASGATYVWQKERELSKFPESSSSKLLELMEKSEGSVYRHDILPQRPCRPLKEILHKFEPEAVKASGSRID